MSGEREKEKPLAVVVGASRGLGLALALTLASKGYHVLATVRAASAAPASPTGAEALLAAKGVEVVTGVDVTKSSKRRSESGEKDGGGDAENDDEDEEGCESRLRAALAGRPVSLAIFNAAVMSVEKDLISGAGFDEEASRRQYESNALGFLRASAALAPALVKQAAALRSSSSSEPDKSREPTATTTTTTTSTPKLVLISSKMASLGRLAEAPGGGMYGYRASKAAANAVALSLARDLFKHNVAVGMVHPGTVATDMYREYHGGGGSKALVPSAGVVEPEAAAAAVLAVVDEKVSLERTGVFWNEAGEVLPY